MTDRRKLERIASDLDDLSLTIEEIEAEVEAGPSNVVESLERAREGVDRATDLIEESLPDPPDQE